jgi:hypothetical protein
MGTPTETRSRIPILLGCVLFVTLCLRLVQVSSILATLQSQGSTIFAGGHRVESSQSWRAERSSEPSRSVVDWAVRVGRHLSHSTYCLTLHVPLIAKATPELAARGPSMRLASEGRPNSRRFAEMWTRSTPQHRALLMTS